MRLTQFLRKQHMGRMIKRHWKVQGNRKVLEIPIPPLLLKKGVTIHDPLQTTTTAQETQTQFELPAPYAQDRRENFDEKHPLWKDQMVYRYYEDIRMMQGAEQALNLTKTIKYDGLPPCLSSLVGKFPLSEEHHSMVQEHIKLALIWNAKQKKLPQWRLFPLLNRKLTRFYGIRLEERIRNLVRQLVLASEKLTGHLPGSLGRMKIESPICRTFLTKEDSPLLFSPEAELLITSPEPLAPFATPDEVKQTEDVPVVDIHPLKFNLNLVQTNVYMEGNYPVILPGAPSSNLHTLFVGHSINSRWEPSQKLARAITSCFAFASSLALCKYGANVKELPEPVRVQCVYTDLQNFGFLAYQLNTVGLENESGQKNQVWVDGPYQLYDKCNEYHVLGIFGKDLKYLMEKGGYEPQKPGLTGYNPQVFERVLAFYLNGLTGI